MSLVIYILIGFVIALFGAYVLKFQSATQYWGKIMSGEKPISTIAQESLTEKGYVDRTELFKESLKGNQIQDAITPPSLTIMAFLFFSSLLAYPIYGGIQFSWIIGITSFFSLFIVTQFLKRLYPHYLSFFWKRKIINSLNIRKAKYENMGDVLKAEAVEFFKNLIEETDYE